MGLAVVGKPLRVGMCCVALASARAQLELPEPLRRAIEARRRIRTAAVELMWPRPDGVPIFYTARLAPQDAAWVNWGDPEGLVGDDPQREGRPHSVLRQNKSRTLRSYDHDRTFAEYYATPEARAENIPDLRSLGLMFFTSYEDPQSTIGRIARAGLESFDVEQQDGLQVVTAHTRQGDVTWWIDPSKDSQPVRVALSRDGRVVREARIELDRIDGVWFPSRVETVTCEPDGRVHSQQVMEVFYAEFNRPEHPQHLTPADIGLEPGILVTRHPSKKDSEALVWDGHKLVPFSQYRGTFPHQRNGDAQPAAPRADLSFDAQVRRKLSAWEEYTRDFIQRHKLDRVRAGRAWRTLRACQQQAHRRVDRYRCDLSRPHSPAGRSPQAARRRQERIARLLAELDHIFEQRLKPGLRRLLTRAERQAEEQYERRHRAAAQRAGTP